MRYLIGLDIGTSSIKGVLMSVDGKIKKEAHASFKYTTAENIAYWLFEEFSARLPENDVLLKVTLYENPRQGVTITKQMTLHKFT